ncbi:MAG: prefoldin subunit alpha [Candidatus Woesearchaeota archaeon]
MMAANEDQLKEKYLALQMLAGKMKQIEAQVQAVSERLAQIREVEDSLDELKAAKAGSEALVPVSEGIFVKAAIKDTASLIVNVGSGVCVEKTPEQTKELLNQRVSELAAHRTQLIAELEMQAMQADKLETELSKLSR